MRQHDSPLLSYSYMSVTVAHSVTVAEYMQNAVYHLRDGLQGSDESDDPRPTDSSLLAPRTQVTMSGTRTPEPTSTATHRSLTFGALAIRVVAGVLFV